MAGFREGVVEEVLARSDDLVRLRVVIEGTTVDAVAFPRMVVTPREGQRVVVNTTGIDLGLGTGGEAFVLWNLDEAATVDPGEGHIVKLRYTPWQTEILAAEAPESPHHEVLRTASSLGSLPVVAGTLHSQIAGIAAGVKASAPGARIGYLMTDGGALPIGWSRLVESLRANGLIDVTCTSGHAFGGDLESVNVFTGLLALRYAAEADVAIVSLGPGVVGTGTTFGHTSLEQGQILDAVDTLEGRPVAALRLSFADERARHRGLSHHSAVALGRVARARARVAAPRLPEAQLQIVMDQLEEAGVTSKHDVVVADPAPGLDLLRGLGVRPTTMGKAFEEVPELFAAGAAAGAVAAAMLPDGPR